MNTDQIYDNIKTNDAAPLPESMIESLRDIGYTPETAVSDIIDNAIYAKAKNIWIDFDWNNGQPQIRFTDDGIGMTDEELILAMRPGSQSPSVERDKNDLGRFGLGLKTASFSQCRIFTVISKKEKSEAVYWRWDIDFVIKHAHGWKILNMANPEDIARIEGMKTGTMVVWENPDRLTGKSKKKNKKKDTEEDDFYKTAARVKRHTEMIFHRYIETGKIKIKFNGTDAIAWDPFFRGETATQPLPECNLENGNIKIKPYILPHRSKITPDIWQESEDRGGWDRLQGFYIYRNERIILAADWLGFTRKKSHYKLARIMIDLPNHLDHEWQIDIKKSSAIPPLSVREDLKAIFRATVTDAELVYRHRGKETQRTLPKEFTFVWREFEKDKRYYFRINRDHPVITELKAKLPDSNKDIERLLRLIEETVPGPTIIARENEYPDGLTSPFDEKSDDELTGFMKELLRGWKKQGLSNQDAKHRLLTTEPFSDYPQLIETLTDE